MAHDIDTLVKEWNDFKRQWDDYVRYVIDLKRELQEMRRELGVGQGRMLADQMDNMEQGMRRNDDLITQISRDSTAIRKEVEFNKNNMAEVMKALALIYRNVDELEEATLPEEPNT